MRNQMKYPTPKRWEERPKLIEQMNTSRLSDEEDPKVKSSVQKTSRLSDEEDPNAKACK